MCKARNRGRLFVRCALRASSEVSVSYKSPLSQLLAGLLGGLASLLASLLGLLANLLNTHGIPPLCLMNPRRDAYHPTLPSIS